MKKEKGKKPRGQPKKYFTPQEAKQAKVQKQKERRLKKASEKQDGFEARLKIAESQIAELKGIINDIQEANQLDDMSMLSSYATAVG